MPYANANNISLYYEVHGTSGSPLLMIHGLGASKVDWSPEAIQMLSMHHKVIIFDNRGVGQSDEPTAPYSMADLASDAVGILDNIGIDKAHVFGGSMGGVIAQYIALNHSDRVQSLMLACTAAGMGNPQYIEASQEVLTQFSKPSSGDRAQDAREFWKILHPPAYLEAHSDVLEQKLQRTLALEYPEMSDSALQLQMEAVENSNTYEKLSQITCPTLVLTGAEDIMVPPENSRILAERIPNAQLIEYLGYGHDFFSANEENVAQDMLAFVHENEVST